MLQRCPQQIGGDHLARHEVRCSRQHAQGHGVLGVQRDKPFVAQGEGAGHIAAVAGRQRAVLL